MLIKIFKILQTLCAVYGLEVVNNHMLSGRSMDNPVTQTSLPAERFDLRHPCHTQEFILTVFSFSERTSGEQRPRGVGERMKQ